MKPQWKRPWDPPQETTYRPVHKSEYPACPPGPAAPGDIKRAAPNQPKILFLTRNYQTIAKN